MLNMNNQLELSFSKHSELYDILIKHSKRFRIEKYLYKLFKQKYKKFKDIING